MKKYDISGEWKLYKGTLTDEQIAENQYIELFDDTIILPDTISNAGKAPLSDVDEEGFLTDLHKYQGDAWFYKEIKIEKVENKCSCIFLERTRISTVYIDGIKLDTLDSFVAPHVHRLPENILSGTHKLLIKVTNEGYKTSGGHMTSPDTQTNWNGILGRIEVNVYESLHIDNLWIKTEKISEDGTEAFLFVKATVHGAVLGEDISYSIERLYGTAGDVQIVDVKPVTNGAYGIHGVRTTIVVLHVKGENLIWDEYNRNVFVLTGCLRNGESISQTFGMRMFSSDGLKLLINGKQTFLFGKHDGMIWPMTGYAPMDKNSWYERFKTAMEYGINHYRFHTCCPPEAAFEAADQLGIYLEPEIPFWGSIAAEGEEGYSEEEQKFLFGEGYNMLREFGNHPSFCMLSMGNELWGNRKYIDDIISRFKEVDNRVLYVGGSNSFQFFNEIMKNEDVYCNVRFSKDRLFRGSYAMCDAPQGHVQMAEPSSNVDYDSIILPESISDEQTGDSGERYIEIQYGTGTKKVKVSGDGSEIIPDRPVISHEVGQYYSFPDLDEINKYTGCLKASYLNIYKDRLEKADLLPMAKVFNKASGALAVQCYKREIESALMSENLSGFQLLDIQDFNGQNVALVGILDAFMENKGFISAKEWRGFCSQRVAMAKFNSFIFKAGESASVPVVASVADFFRITSVKVVYGIFEGDRMISGGEIKSENIEKRVNEIGSISLDEATKSKTDVPVKYTLKLSIYASNGENGLFDTIKAAVPSSENKYDFYVYPECNVVISKDKIEDKDTGNILHIVDSIEKAEKIIAKGEKAICIMDQLGEAGYIPGTYCTDFWNYKMFSMISRDQKKPEPVGTVGLAIDNEDSLLSRFSSEFYTTPAWYKLVSHSNAHILDGENDIRIVVQPIDNPDRCHKLGMLYYKNNVLVCSSRLWEVADCIEIKSFARSILNDIFLI